MVFFQVRGLSGVQVYRPGTGGRTGLNGYGTQTEHAQQ
jgi:hypothetical protein